MRLIVACPHCQRQYDASPRPIGSRFRCHCGEGLQVVAPSGHAADVVRCSSCAGPREKRATNCNFCGADFSIHEKDMHTVCPGCLAVVSDRARYCHHCGLGIHPESAAGETTTLPCPECGAEQFLISRALGAAQAAAMECSRCGGLWLGNEVFQKLVDQTAALAVPPVDATRSRSAGPAAMHEEEGWRYRPCPVCQQRMPRKNYGRKSGVIIDLCRGHGMWFDANELPRILAWVRRGGLRVAAARDAEAAKADQRRRELDRRVESQRMWLDSRNDLHGRRTSRSDLTGMFDFLSRLFG